MLVKNTLLAVGLSFIAMASTAQAKGLSDLVPKFSVKNGLVVVKNIGLSTSKRVYVTIRCKRVGGGSCPDPKPILAAPYENPLFPNRATVKVPRLKPGGVFKHKLKFFKSLKFKKGKYRFFVKADASNIQAEMNEANNAKIYGKVVP